MRTLVDANNVKMISLIEAIQQKNIWWFWVSATTTIFGILWRYPKYTHLRYLVRIISVSLIGLFIITLFLLNIISSPTVYILLLFYVSLAYITHRTIRKPIYPLTSKIKNIDKLLQEGDFSKLDKIFENEPWHIVYTSAKLEWNKRKASKFFLQDRHKEAYQTYVKLMKLNLFPDELAEIKLKQVRVLLELGDTLKARSIFEQISNSDTLKDRFDILSLQASFDEKAGEFENAQQSLLKAVGKFDETVDIGLVE